MRSMRRVGIREEGRTLVRSAARDIADHFCDESLCGLIIAHIKTGCRDFLDGFQDAGSNLLNLSRAEQVDIHVRLYLALLVSQCVPHSQAGGAACGQGTGQCANDQNADQPGEDSAEAVHRGHGGGEDRQADSRGQYDRDGDGEQDADEPTDQPDYHALHDHDALNVAVRRADGAHHADLARALQHVDAHHAHQSQPTDDGDHCRHDQHEVDEDVGLCCLILDKICAQLRAAYLHAAFRVERLQLVVDPLLRSGIMSAGDHPQGIHLPGLVDQAADVLIVDVQQRRIDVPRDGIDSDDVPLCLFVIDLDLQPVADLQIRKDPQQMIADDNRILIAWREPTAGGDDRVDQGRIGGRCDEQNLSPRLLVVRDERSGVFQPAFHALHAGYALGHLGHLVKAIGTAKADVDVRQEITLNVVDDLVERGP